MVEVWNNFRQGDNEAFSTLFEVYLDSLYRYGLKFVQDENLVKDCVQDLFVKLYSNRSSLSPTANPKFYLLHSLKNMIIDSLARDKRMSYISSNDLPFIATVYYESEEESIDDEKINQKVQKALSVLNDRQKEAIYLKYQLDLSYEEVSQLLDINYQSARNLIHRAITKIRSVTELSVFVLLFCSYIP